MTHRELRRSVCDANRLLATTGLVHKTFGNVSGVDFDAGVFAIKPSGVPYADLTPADIVAVSIEDGQVVDSKRRPSSDTPTHLELYRAFKCGGIVHTHSEAATTLAQGRMPLRCMGTTHADYLRGDVPVTRPLRADEIEREYERNTGLVIVETFHALGISPEEVPAVLVANHAPFTWGPDPVAAVELAELLELLARMELTLRTVATGAEKPAAHLVDKHYFRKHGASAYYGQPH